ncbi:hypothetical protein NMY22_g5005 [Coprinellus aureogranulatus]|nr:hypothetical protein NMY22_g5005 [Coprinellus aureogranulatus]
MKIIRYTKLESSAMSSNSSPEESPIAVGRPGVPGDSSVREEAVRSPSVHQTKAYTAFWVKQNSNGGVVMKLQNLDIADRRNLVINSRTPLVVLVNTELAQAAWLIIMVMSCCLAWKGFLAMFH